MLPDRLRPLYPSGPNVYFLVADRLRPLHPGGPNDYFPMAVPVCPQMNIKIIPTTSDGHLYRIHLVRLYRIALTGIMFSHGNGAPGASGIGLTSGKLLIIFEIKIYQKLPIYLTDSSSASLATALVQVETALAGPSHRQRQAGGADRARCPAP